MKLYSRIISSALIAVFVLSALAAGAFGETIYAARRDHPKGTDGIFDVILNAYDTTTGNNVTPTALTGESRTYATSSIGSYMEYHDGNLYIAGGAAADTSNEIRVYNATTGAYDKSYTTPSGTNVRGISFDSSGNLYYGTAGGGIGKITSSGTIDSSWGASSFDTIGDLEVYGDTLYVGTLDADAEYGIWVYDLTASSGGGAYQLDGTADKRVSGIAFTDDGTMYTVSSSTSGANVENIVKWSVDSYGTYEIAETIALGSSAGATDIDYADGCLYVSINDDDPAIVKYDLATGTTSTWQTTSSTYYKAQGLAVGPTLVPEPGTLVLLASGLIGLLAYAWRKRK